MSHIGIKRMKKHHVDGSLDSLVFEKIETCEPCLKGKMTKTPFSSMMEQTCDLLEMIHSDVCSPMSIEAHVGVFIFLPSLII